MIIIIPKIKEKKTKGEDGMQKLVSNPHQPEPVLVHPYLKPNGATLKAKCVTTSTPSSLSSGRGLASH